MLRNLEHLPVRARFNARFTRQTRRVERTKEDEGGRKGKGRKRGKRLEYSERDRDSDKYPGGCERRFVFQAVVIYPLRRGQTRCGRKTDDRGRGRKSGVTWRDSWRRRGITRPWPSPARGIMPRSVGFHRPTRPRRRSYGGAPWKRRGPGSHAALGSIYPPLSK